MVNFFSKLIPVMAHACATCTIVDASTPYYLKFIVFMTSLPVLFVGGVVFYLRSRAAGAAAVPQPEGDTHAVDE